MTFYRDRLGMTLLFRAPPGLAFFDCGSVRLMLSLPEGAEAATGNSIVYYAVDDIRGAHATLAERGVRPCFREGALLRRPLTFIRSHQIARRKPAQLGGNRFALEGERVGSSLITGARIA